MRSPPLHKLLVLRMKKAGDWKRKHVPSFFLLFERRSQKHDYIAIFCKHVFCKRCERDACLKRYERTNEAARGKRQLLRCYVLLRLRLSLRISLFFNRHLFFSFRRTKSFEKGKHFFCSKINFIFWIFLFSDIFSLFL